MRASRAALLAFFVLACGSAAPAETPFLEPPLGRPDAELRARVIESLGEVALTSPKPDWYEHLHIAGGLPAVSVEGGVLFVMTDLPDTTGGRTAAGTLCRGLASTVLNRGDHAIDIGQIAVGNVANVILARCTSTPAQARVPS